MSKSVAEGFKNIMPSGKGVLTAEEMDGIIKYMKELK